jgi:prefoldin subunit 5
LGGIHAKQVDEMAGRVVQLEQQLSALRTRIAELDSEADAFSAAAKRELLKL